MTNQSQLALIDGSRLIVEACVQAGADVYVGYPITPANLIYTYSSRRFPTVLPAPDEISALQWITGLSASGHLPVSATSFPGMALMIESINMAYMMELPMLIILVQRMGPSTGTATAGAQGDLFLLHGLISGGFPLPVLSISNIQDCWQLPPLALRTAVELRTPVVLMTSKEMAMTERSFDLGTLEPVDRIRRRFYDGPTPYRPYAAENKVPNFLPVGDSNHQVRLTASTHNAQGLIQHSTPEALANTRRLKEKVEAGMPLRYQLDEQKGADTLIITYGITAGAAREAVSTLREQEKKVSMLVAQTLLPLPVIYHEILDRYPRILSVEENLQGQFARLLMGYPLPSKVRVVGGIGKMIRPDQIVQEVIGQ